MGYLSFQRCIIIIKPLSKRTLVHSYKQNYETEIIINKENQTSKKQMTTILVIYIYDH